MMPNKFRHNSTYYDKNVIQCYLIEGKRAGMEQNDINTTS